MLVSQVLDKYKYHTAKTNIVSYYLSPNSENIEFCNQK